MYDLMKNNYLLVHKNLMKKLFVFVVALLALTTALPTSAYDAQAGDNRLLTNVYNAIDEKIATGDHDQMLELYKMMDYLSIRYSGNEKSLYFVQKMDEYLGEKLFRATKASDFVCLPSYVQKGDTVTMWYDLRDNHGLLVSLSENLNAYEQPKELAFNAWIGQILKWVDEEVLWLSLGQRKNIYLTPSDAFGSHHNGLIRSFPRHVVEEQADRELAIGQIFTATFKSLNGKMTRQQGTIYAIDAETVKLDLNHPLSGRTVGWVLAVKGLFKKCR